MKVFKGIGLFEGYGIGKALKLNKEFKLVQDSCISASDEEKRFSEAIKSSIADIEKIRDKNPETRDIMEAHVMLLNDPEFGGLVLSNIQSGKTAEYSVSLARDSVVQMFSMIEDEYIRQRSSDIEDISQRLINKIIGISDEVKLNCDTVVFAKDLLPSETANLDKKLVKGIVTKVGGKTSHTAILAGIMGIPAISEVDEIDDIETGQPVIVDGYKGEIIVDPSIETMADYSSKIEELKAKAKELAAYREKNAVTKDGVNIEVFMNIGSGSDMDVFEKSGAEGVGLFRTEFLYMKSDKEPTLEEQFSCYKEVLEKANGKTVIFRTLDIGGDKDIPYMDFPEEMNPFLGFRAIRYCLENREIFKTQIKALLKSFRYGDGWIMIPMISTLEEIREVKLIIDECKIELMDIGEDFKEGKVGIMIETPSAAMMSDMLAKEVDFFSIGTNDLTQYTLACDRMNNNLKELYSYYDPSVLRLIHRVIKSAIDAGIHVGMCGEAAGDPMLVPLLIAMGINELSMSPSKVLGVKKQISELEKSKLEEVLTKVMECGTKKEVIRILSKKKD